MAAFESLQFIIISVYLLSSLLFFIGGGLQNSKLRRVASIVSIAGFLAQTMSLFAILSEGIAPSSGQASMPLSSGGYLSGSGISCGGG